MEALPLLLHSHPVETLLFLASAVLFFSVLLKPPKPSSPQRKKQHHQPNSNRLIDLIRSRSWDDVLLRVNAHPSDASARTWSGNRSTPLHLAALYRAPASVIRALLDAIPAAARAVDTEGCSPLHVALLYGADEESCLMLIREGGTVGAGTVSVHMGSALHMCCRHGSSVDVMRELLRFEPALAKLPSGGGGGGLTPPLVLWQAFMKKGGLRDLVARIDVLGRDALMELGFLGVLVEKMGLLLRAVAYCEIMNERAASCDFLDRHPSWQVVHFAVQYYDSLGLPLDLLRLLILMYPEQLLQANHCGSLPLHLAVNRSRRRRALAKVDGTESPTDSVVDELIKACPDAAGVHDADKRLPLNLAIESGYIWSDAIKIILYAAPDAITTKDVKTHMYPFMLASSLRGRSDVSTIFRLLLASPEALRIQ